MESLPTKVKKNPQKPKFKKTQSDPKEDKNRRPNRRRKRKEKIDPAPNFVQPKSIDNPIKFTIKAIKSQTKCKVFRHRGTSSSKINLQSFGNLGKTCIFISEQFKLNVRRINRNRQVKQRKFFEYKTDKKEMDAISKQLSKVELVQGKAQKKEDTDDLKFKDFISADAIASGLESKELIKGVIRINQKNPHDSFVNNENPNESDYYINSIVDRNRALEDDIVILRIKPESEWKNGKKTAEVVYIEKMVHPRTATGKLVPIKENTEYALFCANDRKIPFMHIPKVCWPIGFDPKSNKKFIYLAKLTEWFRPNYAEGIILETLGVSGELKAECKAILKEFQLDDTPFPRELVQKYLPKNNKISDEEILYREDLRKECVFTIDPLTARDLDDAVSIKTLDNGNFEVGVHIADVSHYLKSGTELDKLVAKRATTIYLINEVIHMIPIELCLHCSLLPGLDKLCFSVFFEMDDNADVINVRFAKTVINSCAQLAYEHAQLMIEKPQLYDPKFFPQIHNGYAPKHLSKAVNNLNKLAVIMRENQFKNGALRIDQVKLSFELNPETGEPLKYTVQENKDSNRMIEEFMLLANMSVAKQIHNSYPDLALLRCHESPKKLMLEELQNNLMSCGIHIDISSAGSIQAGLKKYCGGDEEGKMREFVLSHLFAKTMIRARYFCSGIAQGMDEFKHYALSIPMYTHFTSPIRRYADIIVHRLLAASLGLIEKPKWTSTEVEDQALVCNNQKYYAKRAGECSSDLYLAFYINQHNKKNKNLFVAEAVVVEVKDKSIDAVVLETGSLVRIRKDRLDKGTTWEAQSIEIENGCGKSDKLLYRILVKFPKYRKYQECHIIIDMFSKISVTLLKSRKSPYKLEAFLRRPRTLQT